jgi:L-Ala-D/L-Glu epimerase
MIIAKVETKVVRTPFTVDLATSYGKMLPYQSHLIVRITTDSDHIGLGEASELAMFTGETAEIMKLSIDSVLGPEIIGMDVFAVNEIHRRMELKLAFATAAKSAIDMALWDLKGKIANLPVYKLLGGSTIEQPTSTYVIGSVEFDEMVELAHKVINKGFKSIKIKIGTDPKKDIKVVTKVRESIGENIKIRVDANQGYDTKTALKVISAIEELDIEYIEQPVPKLDIEALANIYRNSNIPIMVDESINSIQDTYQLIKNEAFDIAGIKLIKSGGITKAYNIVNFLQSLGKECVVISPWDTLLGTSACLHFSTILSKRYSHEFVGLYDITNDPFNPTNRDHLEILDTPGFGINDCFFSIVEG